jgi:hypothetical protein
VGLTEDHQNRQTPSAVVARHHPAALDIRAANMSSFLDLAYRETYSSVGIISCVVGGLLIEDKPESQNFGFPGKFLPSVAPTP